VRDKGHREVDGISCLVFAYKENYVGEEKVFDFGILGCNLMQREIRLGVEMLKELYKNLLCSKTMDTLEVVFGMATHS